MICRHVRIAIFLSFLAFLCLETPAPIVYTPGEGWSYEPPGGTKWTRSKAEEQLNVAKEAFDKKDYNIAIKAARRTVRVWPFSDYAPEAQYLAGRAYEEKKNDEKAFKAYQKLMESYPKAANYEEVAQRQFTIANRYLAGQWFKLWGVIPFFPSMDKTSMMYSNIVKTGPYSSVAPQAQMNIGAAREKQKKYPQAVRAYETAADRYHFNKTVAADAVYKAGLAYQKQAKTAEYDQSIAGQAIDTFTDFITLYPEDPRVEEARTIIANLRTEQARGNVMVAQFYEKKKRWDGALVYYNAAIQRDPNSTYAETARKRIEEIRGKQTEQVQPLQK